MYFPCFVAARLCSSTESPHLGYRFPSPPHNGNDECLKGSHHAASTGCFSGATELSPGAWDAALPWDALYGPLLRHDGHATALGHGILGLLEPGQAT